MRGVCLFAVFTLCATGAGAAASPLLWNVSSQVLIGVYLAPPGSTEWGPNLAASAPGGGVATNQKLPLQGAAPGHFDLRLVEKQGRSCVIKDVTLRATGPYAVSIGDPELKACHS